MKRERWLDTLSDELRAFVEGLKPVYEPVASRGCCTLFVCYQGQLWEVAGGTPERPSLKAVQ